MSPPSLQRSKSFNVTDQGHRTGAAVLLAVCLAAWTVQLAGVASLQAACADDLHLERNDMHQVEDILAESSKYMKTMREYLQAQADLLRAINVTANPMLGQLMAVPAVRGALVNPATNATLTLTVASNLLKMMQRVTYRTVSGVFTLTPDSECRDYYRYQWLNTFMQLVVLIVAWYALFFDLLHQARVCICSLLTCASVLSIENAHTFYHVRKYAPDVSLVRGKVFFIGCIVTVSTNLLLLMVLGIHDEQAPRTARTPSFPVWGGGSGNSEMKNRPSEDSAEAPVANKANV